MNLRRATHQALFGIGGVLLSASVSAQQQEGKSAPEQVWLRDSRLTGGPGIRTDRWVIQPGVGASFGYDSNIFLRSGNDTAASGGNVPVADAFKLAITPFVTLASRAADLKPAYAFNATASASYYQFFKGTKSTGDDISGNSNLGVGATSALTIAPGSRWSGQLRGSFSRSIQPSNLGDPTASYNRDVVGGGAGVTWSPGGGLFSWSAGYDLTYNYFEAQAFRSYNYLNHTVGSTATWRFLPRTSVFSDSKISFIRYAAATTTQSDGMAVSTRVGLNGLVTNAFGFLVAGGWASTFFDSKGANQEDFDSFVAQAEARFYLSAPPRKEDEPGLYPTTLTFGYIRDWTQSFIGNFYQRDRGYGNLAYFFNGQVLSTLGGGVSRLHFPATVFDNGAPRAAAFSNTEVDVTAFVEYRATSHIGVNLTGVYTQMMSDTRIPTAPAAAGQAAPTQDMRWTRFEATLGVRYLFLAFEGFGLAAQRTFRASRRLLGHPRFVARRVCCATAPRRRPAAAGELFDAGPGRSHRDRGRGRREAAEGVHDRSRRDDQHAVDRPASRGRRRASGAGKASPRSIRRAAIPGRSDGDREREGGQLQARDGGRRRGQGRRCSVHLGPHAAASHRQRRRVLAAREPRQRARHADGCGGRTEDGFVLGRRHLRGPRAGRTAAGWRQRVRVRAKLLT